MLIVLCIGHRSERKGNKHIVKENVGHLVAVSEIFAVSEHSFTETWMIKTGHEFSRSNVLKSKPLQIYAPLQLPVSHFAVQIYTVKYI